MQLEHGAPGRPAGKMLTNLAACARYLVARGPRFVAGKSWHAVRLLTSLPTHIRLMRVLTHPQTERLLREHPRIPFKYLGDYVALRLPLRIRRSILRTHYEYVQRKFVPAFLDSVLGRRPILWERVIDGQTFQIAIDFPHSDYEGDLRLVFIMDGAEVYKLIFVFAAGGDFDFRHEILIIVTNIQGAPDFEKVKLATKTCLDTQPAHLLMAAISGLAEAADISMLLGFAETRQISHGDEFFFSYRNFFAAYGEEFAGNDIYKVRLPYTEKPVIEIKSNHRKRNVRKRQFKADIRSEVALAVQRLFA